MPQSQSDRPSTTLNTSTTGHEHKHASTHTRNRTQGVRQEVVDASAQQSRCGHLRGSLEQTHVVLVLVLLLKLLWLPTAQHGRRAHTKHIEPTTAASTARRTKRQRAGRRLV